LLDSARWLLDSARCLLDEWMLESTRWLLVSTRRHDKKKNSLKTDWTLPVERLKKVNKLILIQKFFKNCKNPRTLKKNSQNACEKPSKSLKIVTSSHWKACFTGIYRHFDFVMNQLFEDSTSELVDSPMNCALILLDPLFMPGNVKKKIMIEEDQVVKWSKIIFLTRHKNPSLHSSHNFKIVQEIW
jgi:hypothetical protein